MVWSRRRGCSLLLVLVLGLTVTSAAPGLKTRGAASDARALAYEREGRLDQALLALRRGSPRARNAARTHRLEAALRALRAASVYASIEQYQQGRALLERLTAKLDPVRDVFVERVLYQRIASLEALARGPTDATAAAQLAKAAALEKRKDFQGAAATYRAVIEQGPGAVSQSLLQRARLGELQAEAQDARSGAPKSFWEDLLGSVSSVVQTIVKWALIAATLAGALGALAWLRWLLRREFPRRGKTMIVIEDLGAEREQREPESRILTRAIVDEVYSIAGVSSDVDGAAEIDERRDLDGTVLPLLRIAEQDRVIDALEYDSTPLRVGPLAVTPSQLVSLARWYFKRDFEHEIKGTLRTEGDSTALTVERVASRDRGSPLNRWHAVCEGPESRKQAVHDVATRIALDLGGSYVSADWHSVRAYLEALTKLRSRASPEQRPAALKSAREALQRSLEADPHNVLARFNLGSVLRQLGSNRDAATNFGLLEHLIEHVEGASPTAREFVGRHPELLYVTRYNRAVSLSKISDWRCHHQAREGLAQLVGSLSTNRDILALDQAEAQQLSADLDRAIPPEHLPEEERRRLECLCRAAWASSLVFRVERVREASGRGDPRSRQQCESILQRIADVRSWLESQGSGPEGDARVAIALNEARATVDNAYGRVAFVLGRPDAREAVQQALVLLPDFGDAHVNMASILLAVRSRGLSNADTIEYHLCRALEFSPRDTRALLLLGQLYEHRSVARYADAADCYRKLPQSSTASFKLGQLLAREGKLEDAVQQFSRSLSQRPTPDYRAKRFVESVLTLAHEDRATDELLDEARLTARRLAKDGVSPRLREDGAALHERVTQQADRVAASAARGPGRLSGPRPG
jgi:tetratricopeptide (TPR) repeat protein